jgi:hypothetical protein
VPRDQTTPLCLLLLPGVLEDLPFAARGRDLLRAPAVVAVEPARVAARRGGDALAATQARRLGKRLPGTPRVVVVLDPDQYGLARALIGRHEACELWYGGRVAPGDDERRVEHHRLATQRAVLTFDPGAPDAGEPAHRSNDPLWTRLEELGIARR